MYPWGEQQAAQWGADYSQWGYSVYPQTMPVPAMAAQGGVEDVYGHDSNDPKKQKSPKLEIQGNAESMNLSKQLLVAIQSSEFFKSLYSYKAYSQVVNLIDEEVAHMEPWDANMAPSPAFCIMYKLFRMRLTERQMEALTENYNSPYYRAIGLLYLRLSAKNEVLWDWLSPYFYDEQEITLGRNNPKKTLLLPRIPVPFMKKLTEQLDNLEAENGIIDPDANKPQGQNRNRGDGNRYNKDSDRNRNDRNRDGDRDRDRIKDRDGDRKRSDRDVDRNRDYKDRNRDYHDRSHSRSRDRSDRRDYRDRRDNRDRDRRDGDRSRDTRERHRDRDDSSHSRDRDNRTRRDRSYSRDRNRSSSPSRKKPRTEATPTSTLPASFGRSRGAPVDMQKLRDAYGDASGKASEESKYKINPNLGATETLRIGF